MKFYIFFLIQFVFLGGCTESQNDNSNVEIKVIDYFDREVLLEKPAKRVVALAPHIVENLFTIGAGKNIVASVDFSDYPDEAKKIPSLGPSNVVSLEGILSYQPDLVIAWGTGYKSIDVLIEQLSKFDIPVYVDEPKKLDDIERSLKDLGEMLGRQKISKKAIASYRSRLNYLYEKYLINESLTVFYQIWHQPLQTLNGEHMVSDVLGICGGENVFADKPIIAPTVSLEAVIDVNPQVIITSNSYSENDDWKKFWLKWSNLQAVEQKNLFSVPPDLLHRHTVRLLEGVEIVCNQLESARKRLI